MPHGCPVSRRPGTRLTARTRYRKADAPCEASAIDGGHFKLPFDTPQRAVRPGQSAVLYRDEVSLGGGIIERVAVPTLQASPT